MGSKAIFLDRDDTLIDDPGYINNPKQVRLLSGTAEALVEMKKMGYLLIVVTNQSAIARGIVTEKILERIHQRMKELLAIENAYIDEIYYCPYHPEGVIPKYRKESDFRKPKPGMLLKAAEDLDIDLEQSWAIGNSYRDVIAGRDAGCRTILINSPSKPAAKKLTDPEPDHKAVNIKEAVNIIKRSYHQNVSESGRTVNIATAVSQLQEPEKTQPIQQEPEPMEENVHETLETPIKHKDSIHTDKTHGLLEEIAGLLRSARRSEMFDEFSLVKVAAGAFQVLAVFCVLLSLGFLLNKDRDVSSVHTAIGYAIILQLMAIAFYVMHDRK